MSSRSGDELFEYYVPHRTTKIHMFFQIEGELYTGINHLCGMAINHSPTMNGGLIS
jgi:hypothetical protein